MNLPQGTTSPLIGCNEAFYIIIKSYFWSVELVGLEVFSLCDKTPCFTPALSSLDLEQRPKIILILFLAVYNNGVILLSQLQCREHSPSSVTQAFVRFNSLRKSKKPVQPPCVTTQLHPGAGIKPALHSMAFPANFIQDGGSSLLLHVCASVAGLNPVLTSPRNKFARHNPVLWLWLWLWRGPSSALGGFGGGWGWHCPSARPFFGPWGSDKDQRSLSLPGRWCSSSPPLSAAIMHSCHCPSPLKGSPVWLEQCFNPILLCVQFPSFQPSQSNPTPRLPTPLMRTSPLNVRPEETPSPREYWSSKQKLSLLLTFAKHCCVCRELLHKTLLIILSGVKVWFSIQAVQLLLLHHFPSPCQ